MTDVAERVASLEKDLKLARDEIDVLQAEAKEKKKPWYRRLLELTSIFSIAALVLSILTAWDAYNRKNAEESVADIKEFKDLMFEIYWLPVKFAAEIKKVGKEDYTDKEKYDLRVQINRALSFQEAYNQNRLRQIVKERASNMSAPALVAGAETLQSIGRYVESAQVLAVAADRADPELRVHAYRLLGVAYLMVGDVKSSGPYFQKAISLYEEDESLKRLSAPARHAGLIDTYFQWAKASAVRKLCAEARAGLSKGVELLQSASAGWDKDKKLEEHMVNLKAEAEATVTAACS